jgi:hypothetical protein
VFSYERVYSILNNMLQTEDISQTTQSYIPDHYEAQQEYQYHAFYNDQIINLGEYNQECHLLMYNCTDILHPFIQMPGDQSINWECDW